MRRATKVLQRTENPPKNLEWFKTQTGYNFFLSGEWNCHHHDSLYALSEKNCTNPLSFFAQSLREHLIEKSLIDLLQGQPLTELDTLIASAKEAGLKESFLLKRNNGEDFVSLWWGSFLRVVSCWNNGQEADQEDILIVEELPYPLLTSPVRALHYIFEANLLLKMKPSVWFEAFSKCENASQLLMSEKNNRVSNFFLRKSSFDKQTCPIVSVHCSCIALFKRECAMFLQCDT